MKMILIPTTVPFNHGQESYSIGRQWSLSQAWLGNVSFTRWTQLVVVSMDF